MAPSENLRLSFLTGHIFFFYSPLGALVTKKNFGCETVKPHLTNLDSYSYAIFKVEIRTNSGANTLIFGCI